MRVRNLALALSLAGSGTMAFAGPAYYSDRDGGTIYRVDTPGGPSQVVVPNAGRPWGVTVDTINHYLYWGDNDYTSPLKISRSNLDGTNRTTVLTDPNVTGGGTQGVQNVEIDVVHDWVYYTEGNTRTIRRVHSNGTGDQAIVQGSLNGPVDIALDIAGDAMYWTQIISTSSELYRSKLDGTQTQLLYADTGFYYDLALDKAHGHIYFADQHPNHYAIRRVNLDGSNPVDLISQYGMEPSGLEIDPNEQKLYWSRRDTAGIWRADLSGANIQQMTGAISGYTIDVAVLPEPAGAVLLCGALAMMASRRRREC